MARVRSSVRPWIYTHVSIEQLMQVYDKAHPGA
jgi:site-specific recombinase XerC